MEFSGPNIKKFLVFQETEVSYISRNENPRKLLIFPEMEPCTFQPRLEK